MRIGLLAASVLSIVATSALELVAQMPILENVTSFSAPFGVNDAIYDPSRDVVFATTPSSVGDTLGNRLLEVDPADGTVINSTFVGDEPNQLAISSDGSRVYIGIDGDQGIRAFAPDSGTLGEIVTLLGRFDNLAVAADIAVSPGFPDSVVVSRSTVGFSGTGNLQVFNVSGTTLTSTFTEDSSSSDNLISFVNSNTLFTLDTGGTVADGMLYDFDGQTPTLDITQPGLISGGTVEAEAGSDGQVYFSTGLVLDGSNLIAQGTFNTGLTTNSSIVEPVPALGLTYFAGRASFRTSDVTLNVFDNETFLLMDSVQLSGITIDDSEGELIVAGENRLVLIAQERFSSFDDPKVMTFISNIPVALPTAVLGDVNQDSVVDFSDIPAFIEILQAGSFLEEADVNQDGEVNFSDVPLFIELLVAQ